MKGHLLRDSIHVTREKATLESQRSVGVRFGRREETSSHGDLKEVLTATEMFSVFMVVGITQFTWLSKTEMLLKGDFHRTDIMPQSKSPSR
jgi:hypothetical protein